MAAELDPVILEFHARASAFQADLRATTRTVDQQLGLQEKRVKKLESEFRSSSGAISASLKGLAATFATAFTGRELVGLLDSFTRLQNSLKVVGLEGEQLANVQDRLRAIGRTYGADLESLASTFSRIAQVQDDLGASTEDIIRLNEIVAASLKVAGTDAQAASGALLQLGQAFGSGIVRAEEFNSLLEGALPLAQAAARGIEGYGGSVAKLRQAIAEGKVTSQEFFQGVLRGGIQTIEDAESTTLTLSGAFTALRNELTAYVGGAAQANGVTNALASGIQALANNLDTIIPALATIAALVGVRFVAGLGAATAASVVLRGSLVGTAAQMGVVGAASFALQARLAGAATGMQALAFAARGAGAALLAAVGGPVGLAIGAVTLAFIALQTQARGAEAATGEYKRTLDDARKASDAAREAADKLANSHGKAREEALKAAESQRELTRQNLATARSSLLAAQAELEKAKAFQKAQNIASIGSTGVPGTGAFIQGSGDTRVARARDNEAAAREAIRTSEESLRLLESVINSAAPPSVNTGGGGAGTGSGTRGATSGRTGPDLAAIERRYLDELDANRARIAAAEASMATTAEERAELELRQLEAAQRQTTRSLEADTDYSEAQKARVAAQLESVAEAERAAIEFRKQAEIEQRNAELADARGRAQIDALRLQFDLATTEADRRTIALQILDAENDLLKSRLEAIIGSETANDIEKKRAEIALAALKAQEGAQAEVVSRQFEGALARFGRDAQDSDQRVEEAAVRRIQELNQTITDAMTNALGIKDPFLAQLISIFLDKNVFGPLAEAFGSRGGGGGGLLSSLAQIGVSLFGRSSGGSVMAGRAYRVNEGAAAGRVEAFVPNTSGQIIPLGRMNAVAQGGAAPSGGGVSVVRVELSGDIDARIERVSAGVAVEVTRATAPTIIDAAASETIRRAGRPQL